MLEIPELWDTCQQELITERRTSPRERSMLQSTKLKGVRDLKGVLISDVEIQCLEFAPLVFGLAWYFLTMFLFLHFGMVMYILCHYMLEVCDLLFHFYFIGIRDKSLYKSPKRLWTFEEG